MPRNDGRDLLERHLPDPGKRKRILRYIVLGVVGLIVLIGVFSSFFTVAPNGRAVVKRFGAVIGIRQPGLHFKIPFGVDTATFVPTERVLKEEFGFRTVAAGQRSRYSKNDQTKRESLMLTGDLNVIDVEWVVQYRIVDPDLYLHGVRAQTETIRAVSEAVMRRVVGNRLASEVLTIGRVSIASEVKSEIGSILESYGIGIQITGLEMQDVTPPDPVKPAFNEVNEARQEKERLINVAEKERNRTIPRARGEAEQTISEAEAFRAERVNLARGDAKRFELLVEQFQAARGLTAERLYLETIDEVLPNTRELFVVDLQSSGMLPLMQLDQFLSDETGSRGASRTGSQKEEAR